MSFEEIEHHVMEGHVPIFLIDHNKIIGKNASYQGHFVIMTGFDATHVFYHEFDPEGVEPNKKVAKQTFIDAWNANGTDNDLIIV